LSREAVEVHGLPPGQYQLLIDGQPVGTYTSVALQRHIELQENAKTPQYQQALAVATLNKQRNDEAVRPLRNLWRDVKLHRINSARLKANPDDEKLQQGMAALEKNIGNLDEKIAALEEKARSFEERIYQANVPVQRQYRLVRVEPAR
jgi:hypothetical protein